MENTSSRREFLRTGTLIAAGMALLPAWACKTAKNSAYIKPALFPTAAGFDQVALPYMPYDLEPYIDTMTMTVHFEKHHTAYIKNLNDAIAKHPELKGKSLEEIIGHVKKLPEDVRTTIRNNGGGHWNHNFFWNILSPPDRTQPGEALTAAITTKWGSMDVFKKEFEKAAATRFGSGWAWLIKTNKGLEITSTPNQDNPLMDVAEVNGTPIIGLDVWEHAYYLRYQNKRGDYASNFWHVVNWNRANQLFEGKL